MPRLVFCMQLAVGQANQGIAWGAPRLEGAPPKIWLNMNKRLPQNGLVSEFQTSVCLCVSGSVSVWVWDINWVICGVNPPPSL